MTDNDIIKALKCCGHNSIAGWLNDCKNCPLKDNTKCIPEIIYKALDLINRLQARVDDLERNDLPRCKDALRRANEIGVELQAENERLNKNLETETNHITRLENQIERLLSRLGTIKAEACKEFAERLEKEIFIKQDDERKQMLKILKTYRGTRTYSDTEQATDNWLRGYGEAVQDILGVFDNLLKEMVGDNNG